MLAFAIRRILYAIPILLGVSLFVFALIQLVPGDVVDILIPPEAPQRVADDLRARFGLDQPIHIQYLSWLQRILVGDFGISAFNNRPVAPDLFAALANTALIAVPAALIGFSLGSILGTLAAFYRGSFLDTLFSAIAISGVSLPHYWAGIVFVAIFSATYNLLPAQGMAPGGFPTSREQLAHLVLPVLTLSLIPMGVIGRLVRANVLEILSQEFVPALRGKGLLSGRVLRHIIRNAAPAALALMGLQLGYLLGGSILVEAVFNWPGAGTLMQLAIFRRDIPVLSATILTLATIFVLINITVDIVQAYVDPRMRR